MNLLPCPFCGSEAERIVTMIECKKCEIVMNNMDEWNTRHSPWISVKDRLPDKDGRYFVIEDHHSNWVGVGRLTDGEFNFKVTHWMPLSSLPEVVE